MPAEATFADGARQPCPVRVAARSRPEAPAVIGEEGSAVSYAALDRRVAEAAQRMRSAGIAPGDRVALHGPSSTEYLAALWAVLRVGAVACPLSTRAPSAALAEQVAHLRSRAMIRFGEDPLPRVEGLRVFAARDLWPSGARAASSGAESADGSVLLDMERPATVVFTSGSTARPKAAAHSLSNHYFSAEGSRKNIALNPGDRWLLTLPLYHVGGLAIAFRCAWAGAAVALPPGEVSLAEAMQRQKATHASLVATQLRRLLRSDEPAPFETLQALLLGGGPLPGDLIAEAAARRWPVHTSYGLTEMASQVATTESSAPAEALRTAGRVLPYRRLKLGPRGEVLVAGRTLFLGYLDAGASAFELRRPVDAEGWYPTGDLGTLDEQGRLSLTGRADNLFVSGGENVQPEEVEAALRQVSGVAEAVVVPVADAEFGQRPAAFVRYEDGARVAAPRTDDLAAALARSLPRFKIPTAFHPWPADVPSGMKTNRSFFRKEARKLRS